MSKYNHMKSISFSELREEEIEQAIREWSQGNMHMEKLLWACKEHGIETQGCHPLEQPYIEMVVNNSHDKIRRMLNAAQSIPGSMISIMPDGGNPISGEETWSNPVITIVFDTSEISEINENLDKLYESIVLEKDKNKPTNEIFAHMLDFYDFFAEKESGLRLYMMHGKGEKYKLNIEHRGDETDFTYYDNLFRKAGMELANGEWVIVDREAYSFEEKVKRVQTTIIEEYSLGLPQEIKPNMSLTIVARIMRRQFGDTAEGKAKFSQWLKDLEKRMNLWMMKKITYEECFPWDAKKDTTTKAFIDGDEK